LPVTIKTDRLVIRPLNPTDKKALWKLVKNPKVAESAGFIPATSALELDDVLSEMIRTNVLTVVSKVTGELIGCVGLYERMKASGEPDVTSREVGYMLAESQWGQGYMTEAVEAVCAYAFKSLKLESLYASCFKGNDGSIRVLEKNNFVYQDAYRHSPIDLFQPGKIEFFYQLTIERWKQVNHF